MEEKLARIAGGLGIVTRRELLNAQISSRQIEGRVRKGLLIVEYPGVYSVGHPAAGPEARYLAAVRACGAGAVLNELAAGWLWRLVKGKPPAPEVVAPTERRVKGVNTKRCRSLHPADVTEYRGIPVTTVARTLLDLAATLSLGDLARACHEAGVRYGTMPRHVNEVLRRRPNSPGAANLRRVSEGDARITLSKMEDEFPEVLRAEDLPLPVMNRKTGGKYIDCRWPEYRVTAELVSYTFHNSRHAWEQDLERERQARNKRRDVYRRFSWADVFEDQTYMLRELRRLLDRSRLRTAPGTPWATGSRPARPEAA